MGEGLSARERSDRSRERVRVAFPGAASPLPPSDPHPALRATFSQREKDQDCADNPPPARRVVDTNLLILNDVWNPPASFPRLRKTPRHNPSHPVCGEGVGSTLLDVGGLWSSDEARGMQTSGALEDVDGWRPPARRALPAWDLCGA